MAQQKNIGIPFSLKNNWRELFQNDTWFLWKRPIDRDQVVLKRFTLLNVIRWWIIQLALKIVVLATYPAIMTAYDYWNELPEGKDAKIVIDGFLRTMPEIKFFRLDKDYGKD